MNSATLPARTQSCFPGKIFIVKQQQTCDVRYREDFLAVVAFGLLRRREKSEEACFYQSFDISVLRLSRFLDASWKNRCALWCYDETIKFLQNYAYNGSIRFMIDVSVIHSGG